MKTLCKFLFFLLFFNTDLNGQRNSGNYKIHLDQPAQIIKGLGVEIQLDAIGSGNKGMPDEVIAIPNNLEASERKRLYKNMLSGFRYCRLAMGLYFRGLDSSKKYIRERYPNQLADLKELLQQSGMEGVAMEYWSPAPFWKSTGSYIGGSLKQFDSAFIEDFGEALVTDVQYLTNNGVPVVMWGLQNEAVHNNLGAQSYAHCFYPPDKYVLTFKGVAPKIKNVIPAATIMVDSWDGNTGKVAEELRKDSLSLKYVDAWVMHRIGVNSNQIIKDASQYKQYTYAKPVFQNEFEYFNGTNDTLMVNTAQNIMNWFTFVNSPTWFWLHALKPTWNEEASGFSLGFWRPAQDSNYSRYATIKPGHWDFNKPNFNALAGFLKYMPWNSQRLSVSEEVVENDNRILAFKKPNGKLVIVLTNRSGHPYQFQINTGANKVFEGRRYTPAERNIKVGRLRGLEISPTLPDLCVEFWIEK